MKSEVIRLIVPWAIDKTVKLKIRQKLLLLTLDSLFLSQRKGGRVLDTIMGDKVHLWLDLLEDISTFA